MAFMRIRISSLMTWIAVTALVCFAMLRLDISTIPEQTIWGGLEPQWWPGTQYHYIFNTYLAHWVIPLITVAVAWPHRRARVTRLGIGAVTLSLASWVVLRRVVYPFVFGPFGIMYWPHFHLNYLKESIASRSFRPTYPVSPFTYDVFYHQKADLVCLLALLTVLMIRLTRPLPLRWIAGVTLVVNIYKFVEWGSLLWCGRYWGPGDAPRTGHSNATRFWVFKPLAIPRATWFEVAEGPLMIAVICYLVAILCVGSRAPVPTGEMSG
jgi:hypothetical protein